jgi:O-antigen ligase
MAAPKQKGSSQKGNAASRAAAVTPWPFHKKNYIWFGVSLAVIVIGFILLGSGSDTLAPFLLVVGYCVLIPLSFRSFSKKEEPAPPEQKPLA